MMEELIGRIIDFHRHFRVERDSISTFLTQMDQDGVRFSIVLVEGEPDKVGEWLWSLQSFTKARILPSVDIEHLEETRRRKIDVGICYARSSMPEVSRDRLGILIHGEFPVDKLGSFEFAVLMHGFQQDPIDLLASQRNCYIDTTLLATLDEESARRAVREFPRKIVFGSGYPDSGTEDAIRFLTERLSLDRKTLRLILHLNGRKLLSEFIGSFLRDYRIRKKKIIV